jgi:ABC-type nitrate/sulfonate/bicarbonate transport system substrate-binding protein
VLQPSGSAREDTGMTSLFGAVHHQDALLGRAPCRWLVAFCVVWLAGLVAGCSKAPPQQEAVGVADDEVTELRYQGFVGQVVFPELAESLGYLEPLRLRYIGNTISGPQDIQTVVTGDVDFGGAFNGAVLKLIAARAPIVAVVGMYGIDENTWGGFYVKEDSPIRKPGDLLGKKVAVNTLGAHSEFMLEEYLERQGITRQQASEQVTLVVVPPVSAEQALRQGHVDVATLAGIVRDKALERGGLRRLFSDHELFGNFTAGSYVFSKRFIEQNPKTVRHFVEATARAIEWARTTPREQVIERFEQIVRQRGRNEDASTLRYWRSTGIAGKGGVLSEREYQIWIDRLTKDGQLERGALELAEVFTNRFNPFAEPVR